MKKLTFIILLIAFLSVFTFGQTLEEHFKKVEVVKLDTKDILKKVSEGKPVKIGKFDLKLEYTEIRSKDFESKVTTANGTLITEPVEINTVKGTVSNETGSYVRMTIDDNLEGYINSSKEKFYVERADKYDKKQSTDSFVLYKHDDKKKIDNIVCGIKEEFEQKVAATKSQALTMPMAMSSALMSSLTVQPARVMRLVTDADHEYYETLGSSESAVNRRIISVLNMVQGMYLVELEIDLQIVHQHVWATSDPYTKPGGTFIDDKGKVQPDRGELLLKSLRDFWNGPQSFYPRSSRDHVNLFTNKAVSYNGYTYVGAICHPDPTNYAYGWTKYNGNTKEDNGALIESNIVAHEIGHVLGADHTPPAVAPTPEPGQTPHPNPLTNQDVCFNRDRDAFFDLMPFFCAYTRTQMLNTVASRAPCLARTFTSPPAPVKQSFDYDGDTYARVASYTPAAFSVWHILNADQTVTDVQYGTTGDIPVAADYDGDRRTDLAVFRTGSQAYFHLLRSTLGRISIPFGTTGDIPVQGDYDGDERVDVAIFRPSAGLWSFRSSINGQVTYYYFGQDGDVPVQADYDGDGSTDYAVFRPSTNSWYIQRSSAGFIGISHGQSGDKLVPADYTGDRKADIAYFRNGVWSIYDMYTGQSITYYLGTTDEIPVIGDFDGDGIADVAVRINNVYNPLTAIRSSSTGGVTYQVVGSFSDIPIGFRNPQ